MVAAPNGSGDIRDAVIFSDPMSPPIGNLSAPNLRVRLLDEDPPVLELEDHQGVLTITCGGDPDLTARQLAMLAATVAAAAEKLRHRKVMTPLGQHQLIPWCSCGQAWGHPSAAFS